jgi:hypothetical protein
VPEVWHCPFRTRLVGNGSYENHEKGAEDSNEEDVTRERRNWTDSEGPVSGPKTREMSDRRENFSSATTSTHTTTRASVVETCDKVTALTLDRSHSQQRLYE